MSTNTRSLKILVLLLSLSLALASLPLASASAAPGHWPGHARFVHAADDATADPEEPAEPASEPETAQPDPPADIEPDPPAPEPPAADAPPVESAPVAEIPAESPADPAPAESTGNDDSGNAPEPADLVPASETNESFEAASTDEPEAVEEGESSDDDNQPEDAGDFTAAAVPVAVDDFITVQQGRSTGGFSVLTNNIDADGDNLDVASVTQPANGSVLLLNPATGSMQYTPAAGFVGTDSFQYQITDGAATDTGTVTITVTAVNSPPVANDDTATTTTGTAVDILVLANDTDADGDTLMINWAGDGVVTTAPSNGSTNNILNEPVEYSPNLGFVGTDSFTYTVSDGQTTSIGTVTVTVLAAQENRPPVANDDTATTTEDVAVTINVLANDSDPDGDELLLDFVDDASNGTAVVLDPIAGTLTYTPNPGFVGVDSFFYEIRDGDRSTSGLVTVTVTAAPDPPAPDPEPPVDAAKAPKNEVPAPKQPAAKPAPKPAAAATTLPDTGVGPSVGRDEDHALLMGLLMVLFGALVALRRRLA